MSVYVGQLTLDDEFEDTTLQKVTDGGTVWWFTFADGWGLGIDKVAGVTPTPGQHVRLYGKGPGYRVRGCVLHGRVLYYRTAAEDEALVARELAVRRAERRAAFEARRDEYDARYAALPGCFRARLDRFRAGDPDFRWEEEPYELFICEEAVKLADALETSEAVDAFLALEHYTEQRDRVPALSDGHSGMTFNGACALAKRYLEGQHV